MIVRFHESGTIAVKPKWNHKSQGCSELKKNVTTVIEQAKHLPHGSNSPHTISRNLDNFFSTEWSALTYVLKCNPYFSSMLKSSFHNLSKCA